MIRSILLSDLKELEGHQNDFPMPNVNDPRYFVQLAIVDDDELIGIVLAKVTAETSLIFKKGISQHKKAKAYLEMFPVVEQAHIDFGLNDTHIFVLGPDEEVEHYLKVLKKLGFVDARGIPMYYREGSRKWQRELRRRLRREQRILEISQEECTNQQSLEEELSVPRD